MTIPVSPQGRRGSQVSEVTSPKRQEQIQRTWTFVDGLTAAWIKLLLGGQTGDILILGDNGRIEPTDELGGDYTFTSAVNITGTDLAVEVDSLQLLSRAPEQNLIGTNDLAGFPVFVGQDAPAVAAARLGKVDLAAQVADIAATDLSNAPPAGMYEVEVYVMTTTADAAAGTIAVAIGWTDAVGATALNVIAAHALTATGRSTARQTINLASGNITYAVNNAGGYGTSAYALAVRVVALG